jgi:membrane-associated protease RseP (regulator of RpoE activity)
MIGFMDEVRKTSKSWLNVLLFVVTCFTAFFVGLSWSASYTYSDELTRDSQFALTAEAFSDPRVIGLSLVYAAVLIIILLGHEMGHYLTCRHYGIDATLPYFIPAPTLIGTLGAFIKIKSPITRKKQLFDIGVSGPLVGFCLSLPALVYGLSLSKIVPSLPREDTLIFGEPLLLKFISGLMFRNAPAHSDLFLHPIAFAGWVGILVTAFNLFPVGQLDGGHVSYALLGPRSKPLARLLIIVFFIMGVFFWIGWVVWALLILLLGLKHPRVFDESERLSPARQVLGVVIILIFILSFIPAPLKGYSLIDIAKQWGL